MSKLCRIICSNEKLLIAQIENIFEEIYYESGIMLKSIETDDSDDESETKLMPLSDVYTFNLLVNSGANLTDYAMIWACANNHINIVKYLIENKNICFNLITAFEIAIEKNYIELLKYFQFNVRSINSKVNLDINNCLRLATYFGHKEIVIFLIELGADVLSNNSDPIVYASISSHIEIIQCLLDNGAIITDECIIQAVFFGRRYPYYERSSNCFSFL